MEVFLGMKRMAYGFMDKPSGWVSIESKRWLP